MQVIPPWRWYEQRGLRAFPVAGVTGRGCTCSSGELCTSPGKHPKYRGWQLTAGTPEAYERWREGDNVGIATGKGITVLDWDGAPTAARPATLSVRTPSGGEHWYFTSSRAIRNGVKVFDGILDIRGEGGFVVAPPSMHLSGGQYEFIDLSPIMNMPEWVDRMLPKHRPSQFVKGNWPEHDPVEESVIWTDTLDVIMDDLTTAPKGERNATLFRTACKVTNMICAGGLRRDRLVDVAEAARVAGLTRGEITRTIESAVRTVAGST